MKGLIIKDFINLRRQGKILGVLMIFYVFLAVSSGENTYFTSIIAVLCAILPVTAFAYDERAKWDKYALTMPVSRRDLVISKYLLSLVILVAALIVNIVFNLISGGTAVKEVFTLSLLLSGAALMVISLILPVMFKFGVEKGRLLMLLILFLPTGLVVILSKSGVSMPGPQTIHTLTLLAPFLVLAVLLLSIAFSLRVYARKDF